MNTQYPEQRPMRKEDPTEKRDKKMSQIAMNGGMIKVSEKNV